MVLGWPKGKMKYESFKKNGRSSLLILKTLAWPTLLSFLPFSLSLPNGQSQNFLQLFSVFKQSATFLSSFLQTGRPTHFHFS